MNKGREIERLKTKIDSLAEELVAVYEEINLFYDISESMCSSLDFEKRLGLILKKALDIVEADKAAILVLDGPEDQLRVRKGWVCGNGINVALSDEMNIEGSLVSGVNHGKRGLIVNDITKCQNGISHLIATKSFLGVPLNAENKTIGVLTLGDKKRGMEFTSKDLKLSAALSSQAALIIENARLLQHYLEKEQLEKELQVAQDIQKNLLPLSPPDLKGYDIAALSIPCIQVGGDYYDFIPLANGQWGIVVGDVMGHGIGAALLMATVRSALHVLSEGTPRIRDIFYRINHMLIHDLGGKKCLMTLFYGILDLKSRRLVFSNAGHDYPFVLRSSLSGLEFLESTGTVMGMFDNYCYDQSELQLHPGDIVLFYTDGAVEAKGDSEATFGRERLYSLVQKNRDLTAQGLIDKIYSEVVTFSGSRLMDDDLMLVVMKVDH